MKRIALISLGIIVNLLTTNIYATSSTAAAIDHQTLAPMLKKVMPAVVNVSVRGQLPPIILPYEQIPDYLKPEAPQPGTPFSPDIKVTPKFEGIGSGVIVNAEHGYILTNAHVTKDAKIIIVTLKDGRRLEGKVLGADEQSDIAVIQVKAKHLDAISFADSDEAKVGDFVAAIGNPFGLSQTVTAGVISGLGRSQLGIEGYENFIQTDAPINPGNSGGALVNMQGQLVGINTAIISPYSVGGSVGIGFAIPSNMAKSVMEQIIKYGKVEHSIIGVIVQNVTPSLADALNLSSTKGALVSQVLPESPADESGIKVKDIIISLNGKPVSSAFQVGTTVGLLRPDTKINLKIIRNGKTINVSPTTISPKKVKEIQESLQKPLLYGLSLKNFNQLENDQQTTGVQVMDVDEFSLAYSSGLRPGDVILSANEQSVTNIDDLKKIAIRYPNSLLLKVNRRDGGDIFVVLER
jgi:serine protease Do